MKIMITLGMVFAVITANAIPLNKKKFVETKQDILLEYECCRMTYDEIREQLQEGVITLEQAQELWLEHKNNEQ